jgi:RimJ/RimL family protein N-acetyltransferase
MGRNAQDQEEVAAMAAASPHKVHFNVNSDAAYVAALMSQADFSIGAGGTTSWERCCLGLPALVFSIADNQKDIIAALSRKGAIYDGGASYDFDRVDFGLLHSGHQEMAQHAAHTCDGRGVSRILETLEASVATRDGTKIHLRAMTLDDEALLYHWYAQPDLRRFTRHPEPPTPDEHHAWVLRKFSDPDCRAYIIHAGGKPAGHLRFDRIPNAGEEDYEVTILVDPALHGTGIAAAALRASEKLMPHAAMHAEILPANDTSGRLFSAAGFKKTEGNWYVKRKR